MHNMTIFSRKKELNSLIEFAKSKKSEFMYVRGRRRIGKSWLLDEFRKRQKHCFMFSGYSDAEQAETLNNFIRSWYDFSGDNSLLEIKTEFISWKRIFKNLGDFSKKKNFPLIIILDEIQWIAKSGTGVGGALKEAWLTWQKGGLIKVIVCGSSSRFFTKQVTGEEKLLRGLRTRADLWILAIPLKTVKKDFLRNWNMEEVALTYMMIGGVPYYLERLDPEKTFIKAINDSFFTREHNLLDEIDDLLGLDFNSLGKQTVIKILSALGQSGTEHKSIVLKTGLPKSTVSRTLEKLLDYGIVFEKRKANTPLTSIKGNIKYYMKDFFLNFYFQLLAPLKDQIQRNEKGLIFPNAIQLSKQGYYIPNFSGKAFELLIRIMLEEAYLNQNNKLIKQILPENTTYNIKDWWSKEQEIDLILENETERVSKIIECKWGRFQQSYLKDLKEKHYPVSNKFNIKRTLIISDFKKVHDKEVEVIDFQGLFF